MSNITVKYYSLKTLTGKTISNKTNIEDLGKADIEAEVSWEKLKAMDSKKAFEFLKNKMPLLPDIKGCRFLSDTKVIFVARKEKGMDELGPNVKVLAILESNGESKLTQ